MEEGRGDTESGGRKLRGAFKWGGDETRVSKGRRDEEV